MPTDQQILTLEQIETLLTTIRADGRLILNAAERDALCQTVRALQAENEKLKEELFEFQPINQTKTKDTKKAAARIAQKFTEKFSRAAPLAATGEFYTGLESSIQSALQLLQSRLSEVEKDRDALRDERSGLVALSVNLGVLATNSRTRVINLCREKAAEYEAAYPEAAHALRAVADKLEHLDHQEAEKPR